MKAYSRHSERPTLKRFKQGHAYEHEDRGAMAGHSVVAGWPVKAKRTSNGTLRRSPGIRNDSGHSPVIDSSFPLSHGYTSQD